MGPSPSSRLCRISSVGARDAHCPRCGEEVYSVFKEHGADGKQKGFRLQNGYNDPLRSLNTACRAERPVYSVLPAARQSGHALSSVLPEGRFSWWARSISHSGPVVKGFLRFFRSISAFFAVLVHPGSAEALDADAFELHVEDAGRAFAVRRDDHAPPEGRMDDGLADLVGAVADGG